MFVDKYYTPLITFKIELLVRAPRSTPSRRHSIEVRDISFLPTTSNLVHYSGENPIMPDTDIHAVCDLIKTWFRLLPEPIFPSSAYYDIIEAMRASFPIHRVFVAHLVSELEDLDARLTKIREVVQGLPTGNFDILKRVAEHLDK